MEESWGKRFVRLLTVLPRAQLMNIFIESDLIFEHESWFREIKVVNMVELIQAS